MRERIAELPDSWRDALVLREQQGMAYKDIAESSTRPAPQVKTWLHRARCGWLVYWPKMKKHSPRVARLAQPKEYNWGTSL